MDKIVFYDDLYSLWYTPFYTTWWFIALVTLVMLTALALGVWLYRRRVKKLSSHEIAILSLQGLLQVPFDEQLQPYYELTATVKAFCDAYYKTDLSPLNDESFIVYLQAHDIPETLSGELHTVFERAALAKFARADQPQEQFVEDVNLCIQLIEHIGNEQNKQS